MIQHDAAVLEAIRTSSLSRRFGKRVAVDSISWVVPAGGITGLLGPNGAGKTTLLSMLFGLIHPSSGDASVLGADVIRSGDVVRRDAAFVSAERNLPHWMRAGSLAAQYGRFFPDWDQTEFEKLADHWELPLATRIRGLSRGTRGKLMIAMALARRPQLLVLDEPTDGMDPAGIEDVLALLIDIASREGTTVLLATHRLDEVERVCDHVTILSHGIVRVDGDADSLRGEWTSITARGAVDDEQSRRIARHSAVHSIANDGEEVHVVVSGEADAVSQLLTVSDVAGIQHAPMSIRDIYLAVTNYDASRRDG